MRNVAERLGIAPMSLYTYVDTKAALIDLMVDRITAEVPREPFGDAAVAGAPGAASRATCWRTTPSTPGSLQIAMSRPPLGPGISDLYEHQLSAVEGIGLTDLQMDAVVALIGGFVAGVARAAHDAARSRDLSGQTDTEWWAANAPILDRVIDGPAIRSRAGRHGRRRGVPVDGEPRPRVRVRPPTILDGVERLLARRPAPRPARRLG